MTDRLPTAPGARLPGPWLALTALPLVVLVVPAAVVFSGPLESNGWPARLLTFWVAAAVMLGWVRRPNARASTSPAEAACWLLFLALTVSLATAYLRPLSAEESAGALRVALVLFPLVVVALGIASLGDRRRSDVLLTSIIVGATFSALVGIVQSLAPIDYVELARLPGMVAREVGGMGARGGFTRVRGSATHPIEFAVIGAAVAPLALHFARFASTQRRRHAAAAATALLVLTVLLSVTRSGVLTLVVAMLLYAVRLSGRQQLNLAVLAVGALVLARAAIPGLLGTITGTFLGATEDDSVTSRLDDYPIVGRFFAQSPVIGRGLGTFLPDEYLLLDNQYLLAVIEGGVVLVVVLLAFFALALSSARGAGHRAANAADASRAQAVTAAIGGIAVSGFFFDLFSFAQVTVVLFLLVGIAGALWHHGREHGRRIPTPLERLRHGPAGSYRGTPGRATPAPATADPASPAGLPAP